MRPREAKWDKGPIKRGPSLNFTLPLQMASGEMEVAVCVGSAIFVESLLYLQPIMRNCAIVHQYLYSLSF